MNESALFSRFLSWFSLPANTETTVKDWIGFLALVLIASFLWSTVIRSID